MIVKEIGLTLNRVNNKKGNAKGTGKPYDFHQAVIIDEQGNAFGFNMPEELVKTLKPVEIGVTLNREIIAEVEFRPKGFDCSGALVAFEWKNK